MRYAKYLYGIVAYDNPYKHYKCFRHILYILNVCSDELGTPDKNSYYFVIKQKLRCHIISFQNSPVWRTKNPFWAKQHPETWTNHCKRLSEGWTLSAARVIRDKFSLKHAQLCWLGEFLEYNMGLGPGGGSSEGQMHRFHKINTIMHAMKQCPAFRPHTVSTWKKAKAESFCTLCNKISQPREIWSKSIQ